MRSPPCNSRAGLPRGTDHRGTRGTEVGPHGVRETRTRVSSNLIEWQDERTTEGTEGSATTVRTHQSIHVIHRRMRISWLFSLQFSVSSVPSVVCSSRQGPG